MNIKKIGIIGKGFVGNAVAHGFSDATGYKSEIRVFDIDPARSTHSLEDTVNNSEYIFISVPTPSNANGSINLDILEQCMESISSVKKDNDPIILIRSTIIPGTCSKISKKFSNLNIVFNPEFLTERSASFDFISQTRYILGGDSKLTSKVADLYKDRFGKSISIIETNFETAELIKYMCNNFFATKVSFLNEMKQVAEFVEADWDVAVEGFVRDGRVGNSHINVPGHDGKLGFGGSCFPKDIQAMLHFAKSNKLHTPVLEGAWSTNLKVRPEKDWEELKGRAVTEE